MINLPSIAGGGTLPRLTRRRTVAPPLLMVSMASAWVMLRVDWLLISMSWSPTLSRPSAAAGPENKTG